MIDNISEGILTLDPQGVIRSFNPAASRVFGYTPSQIIGRNITELMPARMRARHVAGMRRYQGGGAPRVVGGRSMELPGLHQDGREFPLELAISDMDMGPERWFVGIVRDISSRKLAEAMLYGEKERLRVTLNSIADAVITADTAARVTYMNPVAEALTGWSGEEAAGLPLAALFDVEPGDGAALLGTEFRACGESIKREVELRSRGGGRTAVELSRAPICAADGHVAGSVLVLHDVSAARRAAEELSYQASHDALTGLINRREFERRLQAALGAPQGVTHALLYLDLDQFKIVNDTCGHAAGDQLLRQLSVLMAARLRQDDALARLGGDEFGVLLPGCGQPDAMVVALALREVVAAFRFGWEGRFFQVSVSIGLVSCAAGADSLVDALRIADAACYMAKEKGRNRVHAHRPDDECIARRHGEIGWVAKIRQALHENRFVLHLQPMRALSAGAGTTRHAELLLRMVGEDGALIAPSAFIAAAERFGIMEQVDRWVVRHALPMIAGRAGEGDTFAINLSGTTLCDPDFLPFVRGAFAACALAPRHVCFEITETAAISNLAAATALMAALRADGCRFSLDDFGSGMASFAYLKHLPVDFLKIDGSFVRGMLDDPIDFAMVESINHIGQVMGIQTIAEWVESEALADALQGIGVDFAQGHAIAPACPW